MMSLNSYIANQSAINNTPLRSVLRSSLRMVYRRCWVNWYSVAVVFLHNILEANQLSGKTVHVVMVADTVV